MSWYYILLLIILLLAITIFSIKLYFAVKREHTRKERNKENFNRMKNIKSKAK